MRRALVGFLSIAVFTTVGGVAVVPAAAPVPTLTVNPACGSAGTNVLIHGTGFQAPPQNNDVMIYFGVDPSTQPPPQPTLIVKAGAVRSDGTFDASLAPKLAARGAPYQVTALQNVFAAEFVQNKATATYQVPCTTLVIDPTCGSVGIPVTIRGVGFQPRLAVTITFTPSPTGKPDAVATPQIDTTFAAVVAVPQLPPGNYVIQAVQQLPVGIVVQPVAQSPSPSPTPSLIRSMKSGQLGAAAAQLMATAPFQIPCAKGTIILKPSAGPPGTVTTVIGTGFPVGAVVKLSWSQGIGITAPSITIGASQSFQVVLLIYPHDELGMRRLSAGPDLKVTNAPLFNIATADFLVVPGSEQPRDFSWRR